MIYLVKTDLRRFSAAHRLLKGYKGKCSHLHGHDYQVNLVIGATELNEFDFVVDFDDIKSIFNDWVQDNLDHASLIVGSDTALLEFVRKEKQKHYVMPSGQNSSAESIAKHLYEVFTRLWDENRDRLNQTAFLRTVEVWESDKSGAMYTQDGVSRVQGAACGN